MLDIGHPHSVGPRLYAPESPARALSYKTARNMDVQAQSAAPCLLLTPPSSLLAPLSSLLTLLKIAAGTMLAAGATGSPPDGAVFVFQNTTVEVRVGAGTHRA